MSDTSLTPINSIRPVDSALLPKIPGHSPLETHVAHKATAPEPAKAAAPKENESAGAADLANISIHFQVDDETQAITVFIVDRASRRVLRSIPAGELQKLKAGDLLKLTA